MKDILEKAKQIRLIIFDVDGVLTDGSLFIGDDGQEYKAFNSLDGHGLKMLQSTGVKCAIITGRTSKVVEHRVRDLGIELVYQGQKDKLVAFHDLCQQTGIDPQKIAYVGDDVVDIPVMRLVGLAITVNNAHKLALQYAHWHTQKSGGRGAAREICEMIMEAQQSLETALRPYIEGS